MYFVLCDVHSVENLNCMNTAANLQNAKSVKENGDMVLEA
jgi:hypothetical protein